MNSCIQRGVVGMIVMVGYLGVAGGVLAQSGAGPNPGMLAADANTAFAIDLYRHLADDNAGKNLFFSPYSLSSALTMLAEGARGNTAAQIGKVLHFPSSGPEPMDLAPMHKSMAALYQQFNTNAASPATAPAPSTAPAYGAISGGQRGRASVRGNARGLLPFRDPFQLAVANALWGEQSYPFLASYVETIGRYYGAAGLFPVDFRRNAEAARAKINTWVEDQTRQKIKDLIGPGAVDASTRMVLTNAVYFKGAWENPFSPRGTQQAPFHLDPNHDVQIPLMRGGGVLGYMENDQLQAVSVPYVGQRPGSREMSMIILLPRRVDGLADLEKSLSYENLSKWFAPSTMQSQTVQLFLPKFKMTNSFGMGPTLSQMGMADAFSSSSADFSGISPVARQDGLCVSFVIHKAFVDVNEEGTEAAAATAIGLGGGGRSAQQPALVRADHPFLFLIRHNPTGTILFMGRMVNPGA